MLRTPGEVERYMERHCTQYLLEDSETVQYVVDFLQTTPAPLPGGNATVICADALGVFEGFYKCTSAPTPSSCSLPPADACGKVLADKARVCSGGCVCSQHVCAREANLASNVQGRVILCDRWLHQLRHPQLHW